MFVAANSSTHASSSPQASGVGHRSALTSDFETFLHLLTVQARNQDPLEPLESSEYASQLAQFSMVEQQVKANELLSDLSFSLGAFNLDQLTSWVGMEVQVAAPFHFDEQPVPIFAGAELDADRAELVIRDEQGTVINRIAVPVDETRFEWTGVDATGSPLPSGTYSASLESFKGDKLLAEVPASVFSRVVEAQIGQGAIELTLDSGSKVLVDEVTQIRAGA